MDLIINGTAAIRSSRGARRYYEGVRRHLHWPGNVEVAQPASWPRLERLSELLQRGRSDAVYWSACHRGPLFADRHVVTFLDCINIEYIYRNDWRLPLVCGILAAMIKNARAVVAISSATREALLRNFDLNPEKIVLIAGPSDLRPDFAPAAPSAVEKADYVLMITNALPHKNTALAGRAFAASSAAKRGIALRIIGSMEPAGLAACEAAGVRIEQHLDIDDASLSKWLTGCAFLFAPSLAEGLDFPVAEALACGANALCSDIPAHREFYQGRVIFFDPSSQRAMTAALDEALARPGHWNLPGPFPPQRSFVDVANDYRSLFQRVAGGDRRSGNVL